MTAGIVAWRDHPLFAGIRRRLRIWRATRGSTSTGRRPPRSTKPARRSPRSWRSCTGRGPQASSPCCASVPPASLPWPAVPGLPGSRRSCWSACPAASSGPCRSTSGATATAPDSSPGARPRTCRRSGRWRRRCGTRRWGGTRRQAERRPEGDWAKRSSPGSAVSTTAPCAAGATSAFRVAGRPDSAISSSTYRARPPVSEQTRRAERLQQSGSVEHAQPDLRRTDGSLAEHRGASPRGAARARRCRRRRAPPPAWAQQASRLVLGPLS